jgi:hypothetical protein
MPIPANSCSKSSFDNGDIQLTSVIDPETKQHSVTCDLCSQVIKLGIRCYNLVHETNTKAPLSNFGGLDSLGSV